MRQNSFWIRLKLQWKATVDEFNRLPKNQRRQRYFAIAAFVIFALLGGAWISGSLVRAFAMLGKSSDEVKGVLYYAFSGQIGRIITFFVFIAILVMPITWMFRRSLANTAVRYDPVRKIWVSQSGEKGTSDFMDYDTAEQVYQISDILDTKSIVYGQIGDDGRKTVSFKEKAKGSSGNKNLLLIGSPGTGKSFCFVRTNIVQAMLRGDSIIATDPSGELYQDLGSILRENGYKVQVLNLAEPKYSDFWNCIEEVIDPETGRLDGTRLNDFTDIYIKNSGDAGSGGKFWTDCSTNLLRAVIGYTAYKRESEIMDHYITLYKTVSEGMSDREAVLKRMDPQESMCSFTWCEKKIYEAAEKSGIDKSVIDETIQKIKDSAPSFTINDVYNNLMTFREIEDEISKIPFYHPAAQAYIIYSDASDTVKASAINGTRLSMGILTDNKLMAALSHDGIRISDINTSKCAFFVAMSDKSNATTPIASLFFSFFFKDAQDNWDKWQKISDEKGEKNPCYDVFVMLDEFFSIGVIGGDPNSFAKTMSVNRKRHLAINIAVQSISQLPALYGAENAEAIQTCCDYLLFLGCNDVKTAQLISTFFAGKTTVVSERHNESANIFGTVGDDANVNLSAAGRGVLEVDEVRKWKDKVFLVKRGENPLDINLFPWTLHPCFVNGETHKESIYSTMRPIEERAEELDAIADSKRIYKDASDTAKNVNSAYSKSKSSSSKKGTTTSKKTSPDVKKGRENLKKAQAEAKKKQNQNSQNSLF